MRTLVVVVACTIAMEGCASLQNKVTMPDLPQPSRSLVVDKTQPDSYPGFLAGEGNDLSCRYGIHHESADEFSPPKAQLFAGLMVKAIPSITAHKLVLERFDVYYNHRLQALHVVGGALGDGVIKSMDERAAHQNSTVFTFDKLLVDTNPDVDRHPGENQVGCDNRHEGEYYPSEISGGHDVVVTWLKFSVDGHPYYFRTFYQFQPDNKEAVAAGLKEALQMTAQAIAPRIQQGAR
jgi:hypothetical protein